MTNSLQELIENFEQLGANKRRVVICRLKRKKAKMLQELKLINILLEKWKILKAERRKIRDEKISALWRDVE